MNAVLYDPRSDPPASKYWISAHDELVQLPHVGCGVDSQFVGQPMLGVVEHRERVGLPTAPVQAEHEHSYEALPQRVLADRIGEFVDRLRVPAQQQFDIPAPLQCGESQLGQPSPLCLGEWSRQPRQCLAPPQSQCVAPRVRGGAQVSAVIPSSRRCEPLRTR